MNAQTQWWLYNTATGRRTLERFMPRSAIPPPVRRRICSDRGHDLDRRGVCLRCGEVVTPPDARASRS